MSRKVVRVFDRMNSLFVVFASSVNSGTSISLLPNNRRRLLPIASRMAWVDASKPLKISFRSVEVRFLSSKSRWYQFSISASRAACVIGAVELRPRRRGACPPAASSRRAASRSFCGRRSSFGLL
jgi:hypothetical protein